MRALTKIGLCKGLKERILKLLLLSILECWLSMLWNRLELKLLTHIHACSYSWDWANSAPILCNNIWLWRFPVFLPHSLIFCASHYIWRYLRSIVTSTSKCIAQQRSKIPFKRILYLFIGRHLIIRLMTVFKRRIMLISKTKGRQEARNFKNSSIIFTIEKVLPLNFRF